MVAGAAAAGRLEIPPGLQQLQIVLLDPAHQDGSKQGRSHTLTPPVFGRNLDCFPVNGASRTCLANHSRDILDI